MSFGGITKHAAVTILLGMEAVEVTYDSARISYLELLEVFWRGQPIDIPPGPDRRVDLGLLPRGEQQVALAEASKERWRRAIGAVYVDLLPDADFWPAERLHQKFHLQRAHADLVGELAAGFADLDAFLASTAAARLNAYVSGFAGEEALEEAAGDLGLGAAELRARFRRFDG